MFNSLLWVCVFFFLLVLQSNSSSVKEPSGIPYPQVFFAETKFYSNSCAVRQDDVDDRDFYFAEVLQCMLLALKVSNGSSHWYSWKLIVEDTTGKACVSVRKLVHSSVCLCGLSSWTNLRGMWNLLSGNLQPGQAKLAVKFRICVCFFCPHSFCLFSISYQIKAWVSS